MPEELLTIEFGVQDDPLTRFRDKLGQFASPNSAAGIRLTAGALERIARKLEEKLKDEFERHNDTGETIKTFHVEGHGLHLTVVMEGGAVYVEYGSAPHWIEAKDMADLFWEDGDHPIEKVWHPGYVGDDFVGRAMHAVELETELNRLAFGVTNEITGYAEDLMGRQYTGGQQMWE